MSTTAAGRRLLTINANINGHKACVLIDSGASENFVSEEFTTRNDLPLLRGTTYRVRQADGTTARTSSVLRGAVFEVPRDSYRDSVNVVVTRLPNWDFILGQDWLQRTNPDIDWTARTLTDRASGQLLFTADGQHTVPVSVHTVGATEMTRALKGKVEVFIATLQELTDSEKTPAMTTELGPDQTRKLRRLLDNYSDITREPTGLPPSREWDFTVDLTTDTPPQERTYRMSPAELAEVRRQLEELLAKGWIRPSTSAYGAPILFARKKDGTLRMCVDYRKLNDLTKKNRTPLPRIDELLDSLYGAHVFSSLDLYKGYHQCRVTEADVHKTAFRTHYGLYEFRVLPFGLTNAPAVFQTMMNNVLRDYLGRFCVVYLDDVLVFSRSEAEHFQHVTLVLDALRKHQLHINLKKCFWGRRSVEYLGHIIENGTIKMDPRKVAAVRDWPACKTTKDVRAFLGLAGYYWRFIHRFSARASPLTDLTKKDVPFSWTPAAQAAFDDIKEAMTTGPVLLIPDSSAEAEFTLVTDASGFAVGATLVQDQGGGLQPVAFHARKMNVHERNYPVHEQELLGVRDGLLAFRCYLEGCRKITAVTDHDTIRHFFRQRELSRRQVRWLMQLSPFQRQLDIVYRKGSQNCADALSRRPDLLSDLRKLQLVDELSTDEVELEEATSASITATILHPDTSLWQRVLDGYKTDSYLNSRRALPANLIKYPDGAYRYRGTRLFVPDAKGLRDEILYELHDAQYSGHPGCRRLQSTVVRHFWWPRIKADIDAYVKGCTVCQLTKRARHLPYGKLQPHHPPGRPFEHVSLDLITDLPTSKGYDSVVVFVDMLTKKCLLEPTNKTVTAEGLAAIMERSVFRHHGLPRKLISDRDPRFVSDTWQSLFRALGTKLNISTAHHPETDGQTERTNQSLEQVVRCYVHPLHDDWHRYLPTAEFCLNNHVAASTGLTPFEANLGYHPLTPLTVQLPGPPARKLPEHVKVLQDIHRHAKAQVETAQAAYTARANRRRLSPPFSVGDQVKLSAAHLSFVQQPTKKFRDRYVGPFEITAQVSPVAYRLRLPAGARFHNVVHASQLEPWTQTDRPQRTKPLPIAYDPTRLYIDRLDDVAYNSTGNGLLFHVHWAHPDEEASWEPLRGLKDTAALQQFLRTPAWRQFTKTKDFRRFRNSFPGRVPTVDEDVSA